MKLLVLRIHRFLFRVIYLTLLLCTLSGIVVAATDTGNLSFRAVMPSQLEAIGYINDIAQDATGFMWFAGANGLARYDGYNIIIYRFDGHQTGSLSHSFVSSLLTDHAGRLWVGTREGLNLYLPESDSFAVFRQPNTTAKAQSVDDILCLSEDHSGRLWLGTRSGLYSFDYDSRTFHRVKVNNAETDSDNIIWSIAEDQQSALWISNRRHGVSRLDLLTNSFQHFTNYSDGNNRTAIDDVRKLFVDSHNNLWAGTYGNGILLMDRPSNVFKPYHHDASNSDKSRIVWDFSEDTEGNLWIADGGAVSVRNASSGAVSRYSHSVNAPGSPANYVGNQLYVDRAGDIWVGYFPSGVDIVDRQAAVFKNYVHSTDSPNSLADGGVLASFEDSRGNLWIGSGYGLNYFDRANNSFTLIRHDPDDPASLSGDTVLSIQEDTDTTLWLGIWSGGLARRDPGSKAFRRYLPEAGNPNSLLGKEPWDLMLDSRHRLWIATEAGVNLYNPETDDFTHYLPYREQMENDLTLYTRALLEDQQGNIWVGSIRGLYLLEPENHHFTRFYHSPGNPKSLSNDFVISLFQDSQARIWVGTHGGGLNQFNPRTGEFEHFGTQQGLPNDIVSSIIEGSDGMLWLSTQRGLVRFNPQDHSVHSYNQTHGLSGNLFNRNTALRTRDNQLFFGNTHGFVLFDPLNLTINDYPPPVVFTGLRIFNTPVSVHSPDAPLTGALNHTRSITLHHKQSMFTVDFSALNFRAPQTNQYAYYLEGFNKTWIYSGSQHYATYTNLDSGHYRLHVRAANNDGVWNNTPATLDITIRSALWNSWWAYAGYLLALIIAGYALLQALVRNNFKRHEQLLTQRLQEANSQKRDFLVNTSHQLRTPIHSMVGLTESLLYRSDTTLSDEERDSLNMIVASGKRLSGLINALIDYSDISDKHYQLQLQPVNLYILTELVYSLVSPMIQSKPIRLVNALSPNMTRILADEKRLQQVLFNLVKNAVKHTREGFVTIFGEVHAERVRISIEDSGLGIPSERLKTLFVPFQHNNDPAGNQSLNLAICHRLVELHGSELQVRSTVNVGTEFFFELASTNAPLSPGSMFLYGSKNGEVAEEALSGLDAALFDKDAQPVPRPNYRAEDRNKKVHLHQLASASRYQILVVDDDNTNRLVLKAMLKAHGFQVLESASGQEALAQIKTHPIDLVILDAIMPKMNGFDTCEAIRKKHPLKVLPVIFVSASNRERDVSNAYAAGGSDFLAKPVTISELIAKVNFHLQVVGR